MGLERDVANKMGERVDQFMMRNAQQGKTIRHCSMLMDVSYSTANRWAQKYKVKFNARNPYSKGWFK